MEKGNEEAGFVRLRDSSYHRSQPETIAVAPLEGNLHYVICLPGRNWRGAISVLNEFGLVRNSDVTIEAAMAIRHIDPKTKGKLDDYVIR
jgi:hypothetical protein